MLETPPVHIPAAGAPAALPNGAMLRGEQNSGVMVTHWIVYIQIQKVSTKTSKKLFSQKFAGDSVLLLAAHKILYTKSGERTKYRKNGKKFLYSPDT